MLISGAGGEVGHGLIRALSAAGHRDIVAIDISGLLVGAGALPPEPLNHLLYASGAAVGHVMTDGRLQVFDGRFVADEAQVQAAGERAVQKVWQQLDREGWFK